MWASRFCSQRRTLSTVSSTPTAAEISEWLLGGLPVVMIRARKPVPAASSIQARTTRMPHRPCAVAFTTLILFGWRHGAVTRTLALRKVAPC